MAIELIENGMEFLKVREILNAIIQKVNQEKEPPQLPDEEKETVFLDEKLSGFAYKAWRCAEQSIRYQDFNFKITVGRKDTLTIEINYPKAKIIRVEGYGSMMYENQPYILNLRISYRITELKSNNKRYYQITVLNMEGYELTLLRVYFNKERILAR